MMIYPGQILELGRLFFNVQCTDQFITANIFNRNMENIY